MERSKTSLAVISIDLRNARSRQRTALKRGDINATRLDRLIYEASWHLRALRQEISRIEKIEKKPKKERPKNKLAGINTQLTGTYGKS